MSRKALIIAGILALAIAAPIAQRLLRGGRGVEVQVQPLAEHDIRTTVLASGTLTNEEQAKLSTEEIGKVTEIYVAEGDHVKKGQLLLQIDDQAYRAAVEQNMAQVQLQQIAIQRQQLKLDNLRERWQRQQKLYERKLIDQDSFDAATNDLKVAEVDLDSAKESLTQAKAQLAQAEDRLSKTRAYSPMDGVVTSLDIKVGETAISSSTNIPGSSLMTIADPNSIHAEVNVDEADIANVRVGQKAKVYAIAYPDEPVDGVIDSVAVSAKKAEGSQNLSFAVKIRLDNKVGIMLRPGMSCRAEIVTTTQRAVLSVPIQAILVDENRAQNKTSYHVLVDRDGKAKKMQVRVGLSDDTYQEIKDGPKAGEQIIVGPDRTLRSLQDGDSVRVASK